MNFHWWGSSVRFRNSLFSSSSVTDQSVRRKDQGRGYARLTEEIGSGTRFLFLLPRIRGTKVHAFGRSPRTMYYTYIHTDRGVRIYILVSSWGNSCRDRNTVHSIYLLRTSVVLRWSPANVRSCLLRTLWYFPTPSSDSCHFVGTKAWYVCHTATRLRLFFLRFRISRSRQWMSKWEN